MGYSDNSDKHHHDEYINDAPQLEDNLQCDLCSALNFLEREVAIELERENEREQDDINLNNGGDTKEEDDNSDSQQQHSESSLASSYPSIIPDSPPSTSPSSHVSFASPLLPSSNASSAEDDNRPLTATPSDKRPFIR